MPVVVTEDRGETEVSEATLRDLLLRVASDSLIGVTRQQNEGEQKQRLHDVVDGTWTKMLPIATAAMMLREVVLKCSVCAYTSVHEGQVAQHTKQVREVGGQHVRARLTQILIGGREPALQCSGCGHPFAARKNQGQVHLTRAKDDSQRHQGAIEEVVMHRYALVEGPPRVLGTRPVMAAAAVRRVK